MISNAVTSALGKSARNKGLVDKDLKRKKRKYKLPLFKLVMLNSQFTSYLYDKILLSQNFSISFNISSILIISLSLLSVRVSGISVPSTFPD